MSETCAMELSDSTEMHGHAWTCRRTNAFKPKAERGKSSLVQIWGAATALNPWAWHNAFLSLALGTEREKKESVKKYHRKTKRTLSDSASWSLSAAAALRASAWAWAAVRAMRSAARRSCGPAHGK